LWDSSLARWSPATLWRNAASAVDEAKAEAARVEAKAEAAAGKVPGPSGVAAIVRSREERRLRNDRFNGTRP
jgi:hypothetical protein